MPWMPPAARSGERRRRRRSRALSVRWRTPRAQSTTPCAISADGAGSGARHQDDPLVVLHRGQHRRHRLPELRVHDLRRQLGERQEDEPTLVHLGMRNLERPLVDDVLIEEQDVEIDDARAPALPLDALAAHGLLDGLQLLEQDLGLEIGLDLDDAVDEPRLRVAERLALVEGRCAYDARPGELGDLLDGLRRVCPPVTEIRPDADVHAVGHARSSQLLRGRVPDRTSFPTAGPTRLDLLVCVAFVRQADHDCRRLLTDSTPLYNQPFRVASFVVVRTTPGTRSPAPSGFRGAA